MPDVLAPTVPRPPTNESPLSEAGDRHSQAWSQYHDKISDQVAALMRGAGVVDGSEAVAGAVGEFKSVSVPSGAAITMASFSAIDIAYLQLDAGDWDVWGTAVFQPAGTTTINTIAAWIAPTSATPPGAWESEGYTSLRAQFQTGGHQALSVGRVRVLSSGLTQVYLSALAGFGVSSMVAFGALYARRMR